MSSKKVVVNVSGYLKAPVFDIKVTNSVSLSLSGFRGFCFLNFFLFTFSVYLVNRPSVYLVQL